MSNVMTYIQQAELVGGPQDGGHVMAVGGWIPQTVYVGPVWLGDGYSAWSNEHCERFPVCYVLDAYKYKFKGYVNRGTTPRPGE